MPKYVPTDGFAGIATKFNEEFVANARKFAENAAKLKSDVEASDAKLKADLESLFQSNQKPPTRPNLTDGKWFLARKAWAWLTHE
jgi:hypothetical protein